MVNNLTRIENIAFRGQLFVTMHLVLFLYLLVQIVQSDEECGVLKNENLPWNIGLYVGNDNNIDLVCLGTIITSSFVLTAAHCVCQSSSGNLIDNPVYIFSGNLEKSLDSKAAGLQKVLKKNIFVNRLYKGETDIRGNIALIKLENPFPSQKTPICMDWDNTMPLLQDGDWLKQPSWREDKTKLKDVSILDYEQCKHKASKTFTDLVTSDKICSVSSKGISTDDIDGGAGLIYLNFLDNLWYIRGVTNSRDVGKNLITYSSTGIFMNWMSHVLATP